LAAVVSSVSGLALASSEDAFPVSVAAVRAPLRHLDRLRGEQLDGLGVAEVVVQGDEPVAVVQVERQLLLHGPLKCK
jgi:hypothetical protein